MIVFGWNSQLSKASWCKRKRWHHLPYMTHIASFAGQAVIEVRK